MRSLAAALFLISTSVQAAVIAEASDGDIKVQLTDQVGHCQAGALLAVFRHKELELQGCWRVAGPVVQVAWADGDVSRIPVSMFRRIAES